MPSSKEQILQTLRQEFPYLREKYGLFEEKMRTIETIATIEPDGKLILQLPLDIPPGEHRIVLVIGEQLSVKPTRPPLDFPVDDYGPWPANLSLRREDLYDDPEC